MHETFTEQKHIKTTRRCGMPMSDTEDPTKKHTSTANESQIKKEQSADEGTMSIHINILWGWQQGETMWMDRMAKYVEHIRKNKHKKQRKE